MSLRNKFFVTKTLGLDVRTSEAHTARNDPADTNCVSPARPK